MGVGAEVAQHIFGTAERLLGVDDPVVAEQSPQPGGEGAWFGKVQQAAVELKLPAMKGVAEPGGNLPRKTRLSTPMGRKKERRAEIQPE